MAVLQSLAASPFFLQRMIVRFVQPFVLGGLMLMWVQVSGDPVNLTLFCMILSLFVGVIAYRYYIDQINSNHHATSAVVPLIAVDDSHTMKKQGRAKEKEEKEDSKVTSTGSAEHSSSYHNNHMKNDDEIDDEVCPIVIMTDFDRSQFQETNGLSDDDSDDDEESENAYVVVSPVQPQGTEKAKEMPEENKSILSNCDSNMLSEIFDVSSLSSDSDEEITEDNRSDIV